MRNYASRAVEAADAAKKVAASPFGIEKEGWSDLDVYWTDAGAFFGAALMVKSPPSCRLAAKFASGCYLMSQPSAWLNKANDVLYS